MRRSPATSGRRSRTGPTGREPCCPAARRSPPPTASPRSPRRTPWSSSAARATHGLLTAAGSWSAASVTRLTVPGWLYATPTADGSFLGGRDAGPAPARRLPGSRARPHRGAARVRERLALGTARHPQRPGRPGTRPDPPQLAHRPRRRRRNSTRRPRPSPALARSSAASHRPHHHHRAAAHPSPRPPAPSKPAPSGSATAPACWSATSPPTTAPTSPSSTPDSPGPPTPSRSVLNTATRQAASPGSAEAPDAGRYRPFTTATL